MENWHIETAVRGAEKRVCATASGSFLGVTPVQLWSLLTLPESGTIFRVSGRQQLSCDGAGRHTEAVVFLAPVRVLFWKAWAKTRVHQCVDASNPELVTVTFRLLSSDLMSHLQGSWRLQQLRPTGPAGPAITQATYCFEMWPKGVPSGLRFMPGLLDAVRAAVSREAGQLFDKMRYVTEKIGPGVTVAQAVRMVAGEVSSSGGSFKLLQQSLSSRQRLVAGGAGARVSLNCHALSSSFGEGDITDAEEEIARDGGNISSNSGALSSTYTSACSDACSDVSCSTVSALLDAAEDAEAQDDTCLVDALVLPAASLSLKQTAHAQAATGGPVALVAFA